GRGRPPLVPGCKTELIHPWYQNRFTPPPREPNSGAFEPWTNVPIPYKAKPPSVDTKAGQPESPAPSVVSTSLPRVGPPIGPFPSGPSKSTGNPSFASGGPGSSWP